MPNGIFNNGDLKEEDIFRGIELIYAAGLEPGRWVDFLAHLGMMFDGEYLAIQGHDTIRNANLAAIGHGGSQPDDIRPTTVKSGS